MLKDGAFLMASVAEFQSLAESLLKLNLAATDLAPSFQIFIELVLIILAVSTLFGLLGYKASSAIQTQRKSENLVFKVLRNT